METITTIGNFLTQQMMTPMWMMWLIFVVIAFQTVALGWALKGWGRALDMVVEWRQRYDAALGVLLCQTQSESSSEDDGKRKRKTSKPNTEEDKKKASK